MGVHFPGIYELTSQSADFLLQNPLVSGISKASSFLKDVVYKNSIFFGLNNEALSQELETNKNLSLKEKFKIGLVSGATQLIPIYALIVALSVVLQNMDSGAPPTTEPIDYPMAMLNAVVEELAFRGILQNGIAASQKVVRSLTPQCVQNTSVFKWLTSPSARILGVNSAFASIHLCNAGLRLSTKEAILQLIPVLLIPRESILHETTGNIAAPIAAHLTNNFLAVGIRDLTAAL